jgi:adenine-specific DNA-methyltransferase
MTGRRTQSGAPKQVVTLTHDEARRKNIPTAELQSAAQRAEELNPMPPVVYKRQRPLAEGETRPRDADADPQLIWKGVRIRLTPDQIKEIADKGYIDIDETQLVWRGKDQQDWSDLVVQAPPLYIQEKIHPKAIIDDLMRRTKAGGTDENETLDLFADFNGVDPQARTEFYQHDQHWQNRMILGDSLQVMARLTEKEGLRGQVQCIYFDPPYGIKFNSNWQVSTRSHDVKDGQIDQITREPEQVKAFRDTWKDGIHSYLAYLRDRLTAMRDLLTESGSIFVQIGDENVHRVRALMDEVFGYENFIREIVVTKTSGLAAADRLASSTDFILWFGKNSKAIKFRKLKRKKDILSNDGAMYYHARLLSGESKALSQKERFDNNHSEWRRYTIDNLTKPGPGSKFDVKFCGKTYSPGARWWGTTEIGMCRLVYADRLQVSGNTLRYVRFWEDSPYQPYNNLWSDMGSGGFLEPKIYVVQTRETIIERCILIATDPGDLVLDPTCGSGTTATVAEQWGRRWITIDTSRVALALARARLMGARYPYFYLADSPEGRNKEQEVTRKIQPDTPTHGDIRQGFVYERAPHITLKSIANNAEIDVIWEKYQAKLEPIRKSLNATLGKNWEEWQIPSEIGIDWNASAQKLHKDWWELRIARQKEIDASIAQKAEVELLYDRPYEDRSRVRVAGPFTVESLSPHRVVPADAEELLGETKPAADKRCSHRKSIGEPIADFTQMIMEHLSTAGVQQAAKDDKITFTAMTGWPGVYIAAEGRFMEEETERRAAIFIGPEFGTVSRADLTAAAREALDARFDALIACGFNFEAHTSELTKLGPLPILKAKMNPDLHMSEELKNTGAGNLFIIFGEPDIDWDFNEDGDIVVEVLGIDVFDPKTGEVRASGKDDIAAWFIDTDYNEESFFVRHAYFLGAQDPYKSLKASLKAEIDQEAWQTLYRDTSRPFPRPESGRFAVKVINHFGDEVMKVFAV